jgi:AbrB family looped-hinge helix DNA binding protein
LEVNPVVEQESKTRVVRQLRSGQITIPAEFRKRLGITPETMFKMTLEDGELRIKPVRVEVANRGAEALREIYEMFAPVRQEAIDKGYTDEEINQWIDEAVAEVRSKHISKPND